MIVSRRELMLGCGAALASASLPNTALSGPIAGTTEIGRAEWLDTITKAPVNTLYLFRFADEIYVVTKPIGWTPNPDTPKGIAPVTVPAGFVTDFASIPQVFWSILPRDGRYAYPAIVHDYNYWVQDRPREQVDEILRTGMDEFGIGTVQINAIYWSVRAAGGQAWDDNAALRMKGEKRILKDLPEDPLATWETWKKKPDVFF